VNRSIPMLVVGLVFGGLTGFLLAASYSVTLDGHDHSTGHSADAYSPLDAAAHDHSEVVRLPAHNAPIVQAVLHADPLGGWNLQVVTENFRFAPENVSLDHVAGEGHAHVYVNGVKLARLYGNWMQLTGVQSGDVVSVSLNSNDHKTFAVDNRAISAQVTIP